MSYYYFYLTSQLVDYLFTVDNYKMNAITLSVLC